MDTTNEFLITVGEKIHFLRSVPMDLTIEQAIHLAAWLTVLTDEEKVRARVDAIRNA